MNAVLAEPSNFNPVRLLPAQPASCPPELAALVAGVAAGEQRALESFYGLTIGRVFGLAMRILGCRATAEQVAEDVYVQIWHGAAAFDPQRGTPLSWALAICRSRAIDSLRRAKAAIVVADPTERHDAARQQAPGLQDLLQATQNNARLHAALERLGLAQRQLLALACFRGMTHHEIAELSGLPLGTVESIIRRSLVALREELGTD